MRLVFVSSTFKDMQFERDALHVRVAPPIDAFLTSYGENVRFGDLRWGVNTSDLDEETANNKVLQVCLNEIDNCKPYMIVFIGERYGWIPAQELLKNAMDMKGITNVSPDISVTDLEIEYGALLNPDLEGRILFYFRNLDTSEMSEEEKKIYGAESPLHKEKLDALKKRIKELYPNFVREYDAKWDKKSKEVTNLDPLMKMVEEDLKRIFKIDLDKLEKLPPEERAVLSSSTRFEKLYKDSYERMDAKVHPFNVTYEGDKVKDYYSLSFNELPLLEFISGESGTGRKTLLALKYKKALDEGMIAIPYYNQSDRFTKDDDCFVNTLVYHLENVLEIPHKEEYKNEYLYELINKLEALHGQKIVRVFVMNVDKDILYQLREINANIPYLSTMSFYIQSDKNIEEASLPFYPFINIIKNKPLEDIEKEQMVRFIAKKKHKEISDQVINEIIKKEDSNNPLYLTLIVERLTMLDSQDFQAIRELGDGMVAINKYMMNIVTHLGGTLVQISKELFKELMERVNPSMVRHLLSLSVNKHIRFNKYALETIFEYMGWEFDNFDYSIYQKYLPMLFDSNASESETMYFSCPKVEEGAQLLVKEIGEGNHLNDLWNYINDLKIGEGVSIKYIENVKASILLSLDDAKGFATELLRVVNAVPLEKEKQSKDILDTFNNSYYSYINLLKKSYDKDRHFHEKVMDEILNLVVDNKVENPYVLLDIIFMYYTKNVSDETINKFKKHHVDNLDKVITLLEKYPDNKVLELLGQYLVTLLSMYFDLNGNMRFSSKANVINQTFISLAMGASNISKLSAQGLISSVMLLGDVQMARTVKSIYKKMLDNDNTLELLERISIDRLYEQNKGQSGSEIFKSLIDLEERDYSSFLTYVIINGNLCMNQAHIYSRFEIDGGEQMKITRYNQAIFAFRMFDKQFKDKYYSTADAESLARYSRALLNYLYYEDVKMDQSVIERLAYRLCDAFAAYQDNHELAIALTELSLFAHSFGLHINGNHLFNISILRAIDSIKAVEKNFKHDTYMIGAALGYYSQQLGRDKMTALLIEKCADAYKGNRGYSDVSFNISDVISSYSDNKKERKAICKAIIELADIPDKKDKKAALKTLIKYSNYDVIRNLYVNMSKGEDYLAD